MMDIIYLPQLKWFLIILTMGMCLEMVSTQPWNKTLEESVVVTMFRQTYLKLENSKHKTYWCSEQDLDEEFMQVLRAFVGSVQHFHESLRKESYATFKRCEESRQLKFIHAVQDSTLYEAPATRAIDGNTDSEFHHNSCTHTSDKPTVHWWQGIFQTAYFVEKVEIYNRNMMTAQLLRNFTINGYMDDPIKSGGKGGTVCARKWGDAGIYELLMCTSPILAKYIRVTKSPEDSLRLTLCEVKAFGRPADIGVRQTKELRFLSAVQDSTSYAGPADRAIDGNTNGDYGNNSCTHTYETLAPHWWQGSFNTTHVLEKLLLFNREDNSRSHSSYLLRDVTIRGYMSDPRNSASTGETICTKMHGSAKGIELLTCSVPVLAKYVRVSKQDHDNSRLSLCEVKAYGRDITYELGSNQSSCDSKVSWSEAWRALDRSLDTCSHTEAEDSSDPWWEVDLGKVQIISGVTITNTLDQNKFRWLRDFHVDVYSEDDDTKMCAYQVEVVQKGGKVTLTCGEPTQGRYVRIRKTKKSGEALILCEVEIETDLTVPQ